MKFPHFPFSKKNSFCRNYMRKYGSCQYPLINYPTNHEEKTSDGASFSSRNFSQSFTLPREVNPEAVASSLSKVCWLFLTIFDWFFGNSILQELTVLIYILDF